MGLIPNPLKDSGENEAVKTPSSERLEAMAGEPASKLYVWEELKKHHALCSAPRKLRQWGVLFAAILGAILATQGLLIRFGPDVLQSLVRKAVRDELAAIKREAAGAQLQSPTNESTMVALTKETP